MKNTANLLKEQVKDIYYLSETDSEIDVFSIRREFELLEWDNFFRHLVKQDIRWESVKKLMEEQLDNLKVTKITNGVKVTYELTGNDKFNKTFGLRFKSIET